METETQRLAPSSPPKWQRWTGRVISAGGIPRIRETQTYVASVMGRLSSHSRSPE